MHLRKSKNILFYFFLLVTFGSINNIELSNLKIQKIEKIEISGLDEIDNYNIFKDIKNLNLENIFFLNSEAVNEIIEKNSLVEKFSVFKIYPSTLLIKIKKTDFLAMINNNGKIFLIGSNGKLSSKNMSTIELPFIFGNPKINEFLKFKNVIDQSRFSYDQIKNIYFFPSGRWDIELKNKIFIKLPKNINKIYLNYVFEFLSDNSFDNLKILDARIKNQIILND
tara:strand:- start:4 stop:675 length:672 start_codon:yes stop_codon:yes gene_type:complete